jgi:CBS domain containing-hemolysin-like protein
VSELLLGGDAAGMTMLFDQIMILLVLVVLSAFFSAAETALFSISMDKAFHFGAQTGRIPTLIERMKNDPDRFLNTILIGNTLVNMSAASLATAVSLDMVPEHALAIAIGAATFVILIFGEVFPKSVAARNATLIARIVIVPIDWLSKLLYPVVLALNLIPNMMARIQRKPKLTEAELLSIVEAGEEAGQIKEEEKELIHNIFELDDTSASEIMTPRADMFVVDANEPLEPPEIFKSGFTRIPVIDGDIDHIIGILNIKDLLRHSSAGGSPADVRKIMREPYFVPEHKKLNNLLKGFKKRKQHMAIVVDEHGGVSGLITLEDALEEIVGEIIDETDMFEPPIVRVSANEWRVMGKAEIEEVNDALLMKIPDTGEYDTFSGYILNLIGRIPREGEQIATGAFTVVVKEREGNRIVEYLVRRMDPSAAPESTTAPA